MNVRFACEICETEYATAPEAEECESQGLPLPMPYLPWGAKVPAFGESGVEWAELHSVYIVGGPLVNSRHRWMVHTTPNIGVSHNIDHESTNGAVPAEAFDPRQGWDAFRYTAEGNGVATWRKAMKDYGFSESETSEWFLDRIRWAEREIAAVDYLQEQRAITAKLMEQYGEMMNPTKVSE